MDRSVLNEVTLPRFDTNNKTVCPECRATYSDATGLCPRDNVPLYPWKVIDRLETTLDKYRIISIIGKGGMGVVYRGEHVMLNKPVAIKIQHASIAVHEGTATHFLREARAVSLIRHPHIVDVTDYGTTADDIPYFVMEYLEGENLETALARSGAIPLFETVNIIYQIAKALAAAHNYGIFHLDLKPENVYLINREGHRRIIRRLDDENEFLVEPEGQFNFVKMLDFGIAGYQEDDAGSNSQYKPNGIFGTPLYMSPEQVRGVPVDARSDIYSLGILFYKMLLGVVPFDAGSIEAIFVGQMLEPAPRLRGRVPGIEIDETTNNTVLRCLEKNPDDRFQSMEELCVALQDCFTDRVFIRNAHRLPGAMESGLVPVRASFMDNLYYGLRKTRLGQVVSRFFRNSPGRK